jgi:predicted TIM-barrel fold metal-dependent hydrolase
MAPSREFKGNMYRKLAALDIWTRQHQEAALEPELTIIDAHHHLWETPERGCYLLDEIAADLASGHNVVATVFIEAGSMYHADGPEAMKPVGEVECMNGIAAMSASGGYGRARVCAGIVGYADLALGDNVAPVLEALIAAGNGRLCGIRHGVTWDSGNAAKFGPRVAPRYRLLDPAFRRGFARLLKLDLAFDAWLFYPQLPDLMDLLKVFPEANVILNHMGGAIGVPPHDADRAAVFAVWRDHILKLARFPNLSCKLGGMGMLMAGWDFHLRDVPPSSEELAASWRPYFETCIEAFGPGRCLMESNFPPDKQSCGYGVLWNAMKRITSGCSPSEKAALYHGTAARVYKLPGFFSQS